MLKTGIEGRQEVAVTQENTAKAMGSGTLDVFATPAMIALMEETAWRSVDPYLADGEGTVGTNLQIKHVSATPTGMTVRCESQLAEIDGRRLVFMVRAYDEAGLVGEGIHERFIVKNDKFQAKAEGKREKALE